MLKLPFEMHSAIELNPKKILLLFFLSESDLACSVVGGTTIMPVPLALPFALNGNSRILPLRGEWAILFRKSVDGGGVFGGRRNAVRGKECDSAHWQDVIETIPRSFQSILDGTVLNFN